MKAPEFLMLLAGLFAPVAQADEGCNCRGEAEIFRQSQQFVDLRIKGEPTCEPGRCKLLAGQLQRVYWLRPPAASGVTGDYFDRSGQQLVDKPIGYVFDFHFSGTGSRAGETRVWVVKSR